MGDGRARERMCWHVEWKLSGGSVTFDFNEAAVAQNWMTLLTRHHQYTHVALIMQHGAQFKHAVAIPTRQAGLRLFTNEPVLVEDHDALVPNPHGERVTPGWYIGLTISNVHDGAAMRLWNRGVEARVLGPFSDPITAVTALRVMLED